VRTGEYVWCVSSGMELWGNWNWWILVGTCGVYGAICYCGVIGICGYWWVRVVFMELFGIVG
jgi:hypothetical protein